MSLRSLQTGTVNVEGRLIQRLVLLSSAVGTSKLHPYKWVVRCLAPVLTIPDAQGLDINEVLSVFAGKSQRQFAKLVNSSTNCTPDSHDHLCLVTQVKKRKKEKGFGALNFLNYTIGTTVIRSVLLAVLTKKRLNRR